MTSRQLQGRHLERLHTGVYVCRSHVMSHLDRILAARLAVPDRARVSHVTRIQQLGLDMGPRDPIHLTIRGDHHLTLDGVFLHRTEVLPPADDVGVSAAAAFIGHAASARVIDLIAIGDWLLHREHMTILELRELAARDRWRPGARQALWASRLLDQRARSVRESEMRALLIFAGMPAPEVNAQVAEDPNAPIADLWYPRWRAALEYEGAQHFSDPAQIRRDISRYAWMRADEIAYAQATHESLTQPRAWVMTVHALLADRGYVGPAPSFGATWASLFRSIDPRAPHPWAVDQQPHAEG